ncbi:hypothetical protein KHC17_10980 [Agrobacterium salinitolerans]|uniref:Uncharacterized protein n=1 Tax=Agrobacterium salinitolerans TaxID=1183413 RepID=A0A4Z1QU87_9HYPH|nr:hypothetical protein [Agrobacterium salinitolerans]QXC51046.1 hypothetical protein KHC17_10980 [Agrobacterium salinitolerans]UYZ07672.1 hypothetical protein CFBP5507_01245 [Agrobacterium salinitolerans]
MHAIFAARAIIDNQKPRTRREAILQEEQFYKDMAEASRMSRLFSALLDVVKARRRRSIQESYQGRESPGCDDAKAEGQLSALAFGAGNGDGVRTAMCGFVHARAPDEKLNRPMPC